MPILSDKKSTLLDKTQNEFVLHGIGDVATTLSFDNGTQVFTISGTNWNYYYKGTRVEVASNVTYDLTTDITTEAAPAGWFLYFDDTTATLVASTTPWNLEEHVTVAYIYWNSSTTTGAGALFDERHGSERNLDWHQWAHTTVNTRYLSGFVKTLPTSGTPNDLEIGGGSIADEDIITTTGTETSCKIWYETAAGVWTFTTGVLPYYDTTTPGGGSPEWPLTTSAYALTPLAASRYKCTYCYASPDVDDPIYIVVPSMAANNEYLSVADARQEALPSTPFAQEGKLLYRFVWSNTGALTFDASQDDFRTSGLTASAGISSNISAAQVAFSPYDNISSTSVQSALEEVNDDQKLVNVSARTTTTETLTLTDAGKLITFSNTGATTFTIPANASVAFPTNTYIELLNVNTGLVSIGITTDTLNGNITELEEGSSAVLVKTAATTWWIFGGSGGTGGATISDDTTTNASYYPTMNSATSGDFTTATISSTKLYFNPSTGTLNSTVFNTLSDYFYKENIYTVENATATIKQLNGVGFNWKDTGRKSYGVIAQELETVLPDLVSTSENNVKSVNYSGIIAILINAVKELADRVDDLENS